jgi:uncharacterized protein (DUF39 family)
MASRRARCGACVVEVATAVKKASQSCHREWAGSVDVVIAVMRCVAVSFGVEDGLIESRRVWMGVVKGFGGLVPGMSRIVVIFVEGGKVKKLEIFTLVVTFRWS